jgi:hypothetical protein
MEGLRSSSAAYGCYTLPESDGDFSMASGATGRRHLPPEHPETLL